MKEKHFQTQPVRERRSAFGPDTVPDTVPDTGTEPGHDARPRLSLDSCPESGPGSLDASALTQRQLYSEALKACHLEKRRGFRELVRGADPKWDAEPALRPVPDDQPRSHGRSSRYHSCGRRPPEATAARLLDYLPGDPWLPGVLRSLEPEREEQERPSKPEGEAKPKAQAGELAPSEPDRAPQWQIVPSLNFESLLKEKAPRVTRALGRELQTPALLNFEPLIEAEARENAPEAETEAQAKAEAKAQAPGLSESARGIRPQPSALARDCKPRGDGNDGSDAPKARPALGLDETTREEDRHPRGFTRLFALCKRLVRKFF